MRTNAARIFASPRSINGITLDIAAMNERYQTFEPLMQRLQIPATKTDGRRYFFENPAYSYGDGVVYASMLNELRPRRVVEVGSGYSS